MKILLYQPYLTGCEKQYVNECLDSTWISSRGEFVGRFERAFSKFLNVPEAVSVCNGTAALHLALAALGIGPGDEVIVPTLTYVASVNAIRYVGATPVFVDSLEDTWQLDPAQVRRRVTARTRAILAVHLYGLACNLDSLSMLCRERGLFLIEDAAEAFGAMYKGKPVGTFGDTAAFSFFGNKTITTGEGGMVVARQAAILKRVYRLKTQGVSPDAEYWHDVLGFNYRMTNICAAIGLAQIEKAHEILLLKRRLARWYAERLAGLPVEFQHEPDGTQHSYWMCSIRTRAPAVRDALRAHLAEAGIETRPFFHPAHTLPIYAAGESFPIAEMLARCGLNLPSWPGLTEDQVDSIAACIRTFFISAVRRTKPRLVTPSLP